MAESAPTAGKEVAQFLGGDFDPFPGGVVLGVVVAPAVVVLSGDLPGLQLLGLLRPGGQHFKHINIGLAFGLVQLQTDFAVNLSDGKSPNVLQGKEGVHEANVAVYVRDGQGIGGHFKEARQRSGQVGLGGAAPGFILRHTHIGRAFREPHHLTEILLRNTFLIAEEANTFTNRHNCQLQSM